MMALPGAVGGKWLEVLMLDTKKLDDSIVRCPYCGEKMRYGDAKMIDGIVYCPKCAKTCVAEVENDKKNCPVKYKKFDYQPYGVEVKKNANVG
jgi:ssDNA-binding Zn-finger/Zn-ribbon topoisomerase 1